MPTTAPCPYCGTTPEPQATKCSTCGGLFEPLSRTATQLAMGAWQIRDEAKPFMPGFNVGILTRQVAAGRITAETILRGPTTYQFWMRADQAPGVSRLLGKCHACTASVKTDATACPSCKADLSLPGEIDQLGLMYVSPAQRQDAQNQINAGKPGPTPAAPKPKKSKPRPDAGVDLDQDALKPIDAPIDAPAAIATAAPAEDVGLSAGDGPADAIEDLWAAGDDLQPRRKRARRKGPNGAVVGALAVSLAVMIIGAIVVIGGDQANDDGNDPANGNGSAGTRTPADAPPQIGADEVAGVRKFVQAEFEAAQETQTPDPLRDRLEALNSAFAQAEADLEQEKFQAAMDGFGQVGRELVAFVALRDKYIEDAEIRGEAEAARAEMASAKSSATSLEAELYAREDWTRGLDAEGLAQNAMDQAEFLDARGHYLDAYAAYDDAHALAETAAAAISAREALFALMKESAPRQLLEEHAESQFNDAIERQKQASAAMNSRDYAVALGHYQTARDRLVEGNRLVELARGRRYYAFLAGYAAADTLLTLAARDPLTSESLGELRNKLNNLKTPAPLIQGLPAPGAASEEEGAAEAAYAAASDLLMNQVREHLFDSFGRNVQLSYAAGVKARMIEKVLSFDVLSADHRSLAGTSVRDLEEYATQAGWDTATLNVPLTDFRNALRRDTVGQKPTAGPAAWAEVLTLLKSETTGLALMTPDSIVPLDDPDFFTEE